jgi:hypothetical protein
MPRALTVAITSTDLLFLAYWSVSLLHLAGLVALPADLMYRDFDLPRVVAWNWSFFPLDLAFSLCGLASVAASRRGSPAWLPLAIVSLAFTVAAGGMAVAYWAILGEFDPSWFLPNLAIMLWPLFFVRTIMRRFGRGAGALA